MTVDFLPLDVEEIKSMFYLQDDRIIRRSDNIRFDGIDVTEQKTVRVREHRVTINRLRYVLENGIAPKGEVLMNDKGVLVDVTNNHLRQVIVRSGDNVLRYKDGKYLGRYVNTNGVRVGKAFDTYDEAKKYAKSMTIEVWCKEARRLGFKLD